MTFENVPFVVYQGADININFTIYESDNVTPDDIAAWALEANFTFLASKDTDEDLQKTSSDGIELTTDGSDGKGVITIPKAESGDMAIGDWEWDLWRTDDNSTYPVATGTFELRESPRSRRR